MSGPSDFEYGRGMDEFLKALAPQVGALLATVQVLLGAIAGFIANLWLTALKNRREDRKEVAAQKLAEEKERLKRGQSSAEAALDLLSKTMAHLQRLDEEATAVVNPSERDPGEDTSAQLSRARAARQHLAPEIRDWMSQIEIQYAGQLGDPDRQDLLERAASSVAESVGMQVSGASMIAAMRRDAVRCMASILTTYLTGEDVTWGDRTSLNNIIPRFFVGRATPSMRARWQPSEDVPSPDG